MASSLLSNFGVKVMTNIVLVNASTVLKDSDLTNIAPVLQTLFDRDFEPVWQTGLAFKVSLFNNGSPIKVHDEYLQSTEHSNLSWPVYLFDTTDTPGAGGYHLDQGVPFGKVFVKDAMDYGEAWSVDLAHEYLEIAGDPTTNVLINLQGMAAGYKCLQEVCDAVEADNLAYTIDNVLVSDWCTPEYFYKQGQLKQGRGLYDFKGHLTMPAPALMKGGYLGIQNPNGEWGQVSNFKEEGYQSRRSMRTSGRLNLACK